MGNMQQALFEAGFITEKKANISMEVITLRRSKKLLLEEIKIAETKDMNRLITRKDTLNKRIEKMELKLEAL